jgi:hypothetical protein
MHLPGHAAGRFQFVVAQDGVERDEDLAAKRWAWRTSRSMSSIGLPADARAPKPGPPM